jgi:outer membrane receptor protein involved in Fe transport
VPFRRNLLTGCAWWLLAATTVHAQPTATLTADIAPQPLYRALAAFATQTGLQVVYLSDVVGARKSRGAQAGLSTSAALDQLLAGTSLDFEFVNDWTVSIVAAASVQPAGYRFEPARASDPVGAAATLEEIIVTARRRDEPVSKIPISVVVWSREAMAASGVKGMDEIGALTPGVGFDWVTGYGAGAYTNLEIRGVTGRRGSTVGVFVTIRRCHRRGTKRLDVRFRRLSISTALKCCADRRAHCSVRARWAARCDSSRRHRASRRSPVSRPQNWPRRRTAT